MTPARSAEFLAPCWRATSRASVIEFEQGHAHVSVAFALGAASRFSGPALTAARDELVPLDLLWGRSGACLRERLIEAGTPERALSVMEDVLLQQLTALWRSIGR